MVKPFVLDNKERFIHFVDDKALILVDNNEPREITFKNEQRDVRIEGLVSMQNVDFRLKVTFFLIVSVCHKNLTQILIMIKSN